MSQRERYLAIAVAVVVGLFAAQYGFNRITGTLREKQDAVDSARNASSDMDKTITSGKIAARKIEQLNTKSLPKDQETLVAQYRDWLTELGKAVSMDDIKVTVPDRPIRTSEAFAAYNFTLHGTCRTDRTLDLMAKFYEQDYLHTIRNLKWTKTKEDNVFVVQLDSQALALRGAGLKQEASKESSGRLAMSADEYKEIILNRNAFSPPNKPPKFDVDRTHEISRGSSWDLPLAAKDPESHSVSYELLSEELPEGMKFRGGTFYWQPEANGEHEVVVRVTDNGWPNRSSEQKLVFRVVDPPQVEVQPEPPKFDVASQAFVSALLSGRRGPEAWIRSRTDGKTLQLTEGSDFELGTIKAKVVNINLREDFLELETDGKHWTIGMDVSLSEAYAKSQID